MNTAFYNDMIVAASGTVHVTQSIAVSHRYPNVFFKKLKYILRYQVLQYLTAFYLHKFTQAYFKALIVISGAFGAFRRDLLLNIKGYRNSVGEDMDITLRIHRYIKTHNLSIVYVPESICYTECPENLKNLVKQRVRWQKAFIDCFVKYGIQMFRHFKLSISFFFIFDCFLLGTLTSFAVLLIPIFAILYCKLSIIFIILFSIDTIFGIFDNIASIIMAKRNGIIFSKQTLCRIALFIPLQLISYRFLNILFVILGTGAYIVKRDYWNKADRLGRTILYK